MQVCFSTSADNSSVVGMRPAHYCSAICMDREDLGRRKRQMTGKLLLMVCQRPAQRGARLHLAWLPLVLRLAGWVITLLENYYQCKMSVRVLLTGRDMAKKSAGARHL